MKKLSLRVLVILAMIAIAVSMSVTASEADVTVTTVTVSPESVEVGKNATIRAMVKNVGNVTQNETIVFKINEEEVESVNVSLEPNETKTVESVVAKDVAGTSIVASIYPADKKDFRFLNSSSLSNSNLRTLSLNHDISRFD